MMKIDAPHIAKIPYVEICAELYRRKNFLIQAKTPWGIHEKQLYALQLLNSPDISSIGYGGSARSGKTWIASEYIIMSCIAYPNTGWGLARKELKNLRRTTLVTFFKVLDKYKLVANVDYRYNQQDQIITFTNKSQVFLIDTAHSHEDPLYTRFGGYELTGCIIDESNETPYQAIEILSGRVGFRKNIEYGIHPRVFEMFNPDKGHVYDRFYLPYKENREQRAVKFVRALPSDNPDPAVKIWIENQMETASQITIERLVKGNFDYDDTKDHLIEQDSINNYFLNEYVKKTGVKYISADIARLGRDSTMIRVWDGLVVIHRVEINKSRIDETAAEIRRLATAYAIPMSRTIVDEDGIGGGVRDILNCMGFIANSKPFGKTNYANLKSQCTFLMAQLINDNKVYEPCKNKELQTKVMQEMSWVRERGIDEDGKRRVISKDDVKKAIRRSPDEWDSIYMRAYFELGSKL